MFHLLKSCDTSNFFQPPSYRIPAIISSVIVTIAVFSIFIWAIAKQGDVGPLWKNPEEIYGIGRLSGSQLSWTMIPTFLVYAVNPGDQLWGQILIIPLCLLGSNILGIITTSCARGFYRMSRCYGQKLYDLLEAIQTHGGNGARAAVFFAAFAFFLSQLCVNVVACGTVGGMDLAALLPRYINIRRRSFIIAFIGICINPWRILNFIEFHADSQLVHICNIWIRSIPWTTNWHYGVRVPARSSVS
ncbi:permease for cytosine/purines, uracil, thiamine, allantoin-domain-containing protein [Mycena olivaceomarginata]|nr:permease for cytosine/purines, uracil, thiamine, allantoin-domain-containing protein [Mycena olivaceomarginata]